jgi:Sec-independent protein translocase protein TatA
MDIGALVQNFRESQKEREEEEGEEENDIVLEEEKCRKKTHQDAVKSLKEL